jgi:hypothetical protein
MRRNTGGWLKRAVYLLLLAIGASYAFSFALRAPRVRRYLEGRLEASFGRPVEVARFNFRLLDGPRLEAENVTVSEDPAFGREYFLRADTLTAGPRWGQLLRGRFEFGTISFTRPSLNLVRDAQGRWNLERWLPPRGGPAATTGVNPARLRRVEFDSGRINFKMGLEKVPFAFVNVSGSAELEGGGRWRLDLKAEPMRAGVTLQQAGVIWAQGVIAGTSAGLQPAEISLHWTDGSLADLLRLAWRQDFGVRGQMGLDFAAKSSPGNGLSTAQWNFVLQGRVVGVHRWDLPERPDNPSANVRVGALWGGAGHPLALTEIQIQTAHSQIVGVPQGAPSPAVAPRISWESPGISLEDAIACWRAFHSGVADGLRLTGFLSGSLTTRGWPPRLQDGEWRFSGGTLRVPAILRPIELMAAEGSSGKDSAEMGPLALVFTPPEKVPAESRPATGRRPALPVLAAPKPVSSDSLMAGGVYDFSPRRMTLTLQGKTTRVQDWVALADAFGRPLNRGWELTGGAALDLRWEVQWPGATAQMTGSLECSAAHLKLAGLNLPVELGAVRKNWSRANEEIRVGSVGLLGATWWGRLRRPRLLLPPGSGAGEMEHPGWHFDLHADRLHAVDLDRWLGPRARPNWLERLLPQLLGSQPAGGTEINAAASAFLRGLSGGGKLAVEEFSLPGIKLQQLRTELAIGAAEIIVTKAEAQVAGGRVRGRMEAVLRGRPRYSAELRFDQVSLKRLIAGTGLRGLARGMASGELSVSMQGIGRDELLASLDATGKAKLLNAEFLALDLGVTFADGVKHNGLTKWPSGSVAFAVRDGNVRLYSQGRDQRGRAIQVRGTVSFKREADLQVQETAGAEEEGRPEAGRLLRLVGPLDALQVASPPGKTGPSPSRRGAPARAAAAGARN